MAEDARSILKQFSLGRILLPVFIGLGTTGLLVWSAAGKAAEQPLVWTWYSTGWILLAFLSLVVRDWMYMLRIRHLTDKKLTWWRTFVVIMLWEFASALAPGIIGGGFFFAIWILSREGVDAGKSITVITFTSFLDGIFIAIMAPLVYFTVGRAELFEGVNTEQGWLGAGFFVTFWVVYTIILLYKLFVAYALFVNPLFVKRALVGIFSINGLRRWRRGMVTTGDQLITAATGLRSRGWSYWWPALLTTFASWTARYSIVNCIVHAFHPGIGFGNDLVIYGKQVIMGIIVLLMPTPGGSGFAELIFGNFLGMYITVGPERLAFIWRLMSYYPYIAIGAFILPRWVRRNVIDPLAHAVPDAGHRVH
ncbi:MAG: flippase-like domain-containing protein [Bacteroidetes bacterium]|nr:flippase-like domain-containing protein [Bacteroidota bacterium]